VNIAQIIKKIKDSPIHPTMPLFWNRKPDSNVPKNLPNAFSE